MPARILVVDDESTLTDALKLLLSDHGYDASTSSTAAEAETLLARHCFDLVFLDLRLPDADGIRLLEHIKHVSPETEVVLMTAHGSLDITIEAIKRGAFYYLEKPFTFDQILILTERALQFKAIREENRLSFDFRFAFFAFLWLVVLPFSAKAQLTLSERRGKEIYLRGTSPSGREITGRIGEIDVPASTVSCAGCHGMRGEGKTEGGVTAGNLTWPHLSKPYGHTHQTGRKHGAFTESAFIRAVVSGVDSDGNNLQVVMPRYNLSVEDMADLIAYVKRIDTDLDPGLTDSSIKIGLVLPTQGALADVSAAMKDVFTAYFDDLNNRGGIFSRKIDLRVADAGEGGATTASVAQTFARKEQIFAFVGGLSAGADAQIAALAREEQIPFIGPSTLLPYREWLDQGLLTRITGLT